MARKKKTPTPALPELDAHRHQDTRKNIPTEELRDFVADDEAKPKTMLYPRDPSLDPQLVWKGKDEQDREPLEVDIVPIYIQEVIEPRVIIEAGQAMSTTITIDEAQAKLRELIHQLAPGEEVVITENEQPVAKLVSEPPKPRPGLRPPPGLGKGMITFIAPDFDAPLDDMKEYLE